MTIPFSRTVITKATGKDTSMVQIILNPALLHTRHPRLLLLHPMLSSKPRSLFPHACSRTRGRFYHSRWSLLYSEGFEKLSSKNDNKHQTELWKHQRCFWMNYSRFLTISITFCISNRHIAL